jgi:MYXO-CTERM domain-containing protein
MSTGVGGGDGNQASHWKDDFIFTDDTIYFGPLIGLMDPTLPYGVTEEISDADLRAMELIGYDTPEPGAGAALTLVAVTTLAGRRRRTRPSRA